MLVVLNRKNRFGLDSFFVVSMVRIFRLYLVHGVRLVRVV